MIPEDLLTIDHGTDQIDLSFLRHVSRSIRVSTIWITSVHHKKDGAIGDKPSFAFVGPIEEDHFFVTEISLDTLNHNLKKLGYECIRSS